MRWISWLLVIGGCDGCRPSGEPDPAAAAEEALRQGRELASAVAEDSGPPCQRAHREIVRLSAELAAAPPRPEDVFVALCEQLPQPIQHCLRPSHAAEDSSCLARVEALPEEERALARDLGRVR